jgi:nitroimidazol reductase NimA-like FMN-containing flavoprotein (pyridoxamine 5'-phosphate oxidase superfamily)
VIVTDPVPSKALTSDAIFSDPLVAELLGQRLIAVFSTHDPAGHIHSVPMWFARRDRTIVLATGSRSRKVSNLEHDHRATCVVHDSRPGFEVCGVSLAGRAEIVRGAEASALVDAVHGRYLDEANAPTEALSFLASDDVAIRFEPESALTWDERGSDASAALRAAGCAYPLVATAPRPVAARGRASTSPAARACSRRRSACG